MKKYSPEDCFLVYVNLGEDRSIERVAEIVNKSPKTIYNYSSSGKWKERLAELKEQDKSTIEAIIRDSNNGIKLLESEIYRGVSEKILQTLQESMVLMKPSDNPRDLKTLLDIYRLINGQPTDISRQETATVTPEKAEALADADLFAIPDDVLDRLMN